ncbi:hypothetical protein LEP1GSC079_0137 [Leptospira interrogans str. FPW1039]|uniref:Uncharacterized protein n=1 Tax=Leptospira interrogans str. FPW1039 TaxID=1193040 RepID=A0A0F6II21_LEPIR|nr:hypothetical protein LEP1GSC079_0137 [Leptospira interrogans str. FPW1039]
MQDPLETYMIADKKINSDQLEKTLGHCKRSGLVESKSLRNRFE